MNWDAIAFDWNHIRAFLATVEEGSLSGAARALKQTQPTLSRQISLLEEALNLTLFERGTRAMQLTDAGAELLSHVRAMSDAASQISRVATGQSQNVEGTVRVTCSDAMATHALPRCLIALRQEYPGIHIELMPSNEISDLTRRDADIAIRHARPQQPDLIAKKLADLQITLFASKAYLTKLSGVDLSQANFIGYGNAKRLVPQINAMGIDVTPENFGFTTNNGNVMYELVREGAGIGLLPVSVAEDKMGLVKVLPDAASFKMETWLVTHREIQTNRRIRITFDHLAKKLETDRWADLVASV